MSFSLRSPPPCEGIEYLPGARRGDLLRAQAEGATHIGLIDGLLAGPLAVTPREVREVANGGAILYGAASLGALRAVECPGKMKGIGEIYEAYRDGVLTDDDDLVGTFDSGGEPLSFPLVVLREGITSAVRSGLLSITEQDTINAHLKARPFERRSRRDLHSVLAESLAPDRLSVVLEAILEPPFLNCKARDALALILAMAEDMRSSGGPDQIHR